MNSPQNKVILMIALDFPPCQSAGVQRTLKFAEYLSQFGWQPIVLTVNEDVYQRIDEKQVIPKNVKVYRCSALDASRDLSIKGKYFGWSKVPDRWWSWSISAIPLGKKLIEKYKPQIIWSTYPVSTAHFIAYKLQGYSKLPWIADYRDPLQCRYDDDALAYSGVAKWIEKKTVQHASNVIFTTARAAELYQRLYPDQLLKKFQVIGNGYDEANFTDLEYDTEATAHTGKFTLLHSGSIYANGRDPSALFQALHQLLNLGVISSDNFVLAFRGGSVNSKFQALLISLGIDQLIEFRAMLPYKESLKEMMEINALVLIQGPLFDNQIPGKAYEYIRANKPILAVTPKNGATGELLASAGGCLIALTEDEIVKALTILLTQHFPERSDIDVHSRLYKTQELACLLDKVTANE